MFAWETLLPTEPSPYPPCSVFIHIFMVWINLPLLIFSFFSFRKSVVLGLPVTENTICSLTGQVVKSLPSRIGKSVFQSLGRTFYTCSNMHVQCLGCYFDLNACQVFAFQKVISEALTVRTAAWRTGMWLEVLSCLADTFLISPGYLASYSIFIRHVYQKISHLCRI